MILIQRDNMTYKVKSKTIAGKYITYVKARTNGMPTQHFTLTNGNWLHVSTEAAPTVPPAEIIAVLDAVVIEAGQ